MSLVVWGRLAPPAGQQTDQSRQETSEGGHLGHCKSGAISKSSPLCTRCSAYVTAANDSGGQHPEWDEELRFPIMEDIDDILEAAAAQSSLKGKNTDLPPLPTEPGVVTPATLASNARKAAANTPKKKKASKSMVVSCYADDPKEPELIGEVVVVIDDVMKKGEEDGERHLRQGAADGQNGTSSRTRTSTAERCTWSSRSTRMLLRL